MLNTVKDRVTAWSTKPAQALAGLTPPHMQRIVLPLLLTAAIITAVVVMVLWQSTSQYRPLFGARENVVVADVVSSLDTEGVDYRLHPESGQVLVAEGDMARARMLLAAKGVAAKLPEGLELMDRNDPLGVSQFVQDVRFRRGLEGELARSIATLDVVQSARVHLSIARSSSFVVNTGEKSSASVVLQIKPGYDIKREQIAAIIHMVANSVAGLSPMQVSLTDQNGNFLSSRVDLSEGFDPLSQDEQAGQVSEELRRNAQELLAATVGMGHYRVTVAADLSQDRTEETYEQYSGDPRVLSEATREENDRSNSVALGVPGSLSNRPVNLPKDDANGKDANGNFRAAVSRNFAYDRSVVQVKRGKGRINKLSVAVVLDDNVAPGEATSWQPADIERVEKLLRVGMGLDDVRGDQLAISSMAFRQTTVEHVWWKDPAHWYSWIVTALWVIGGALLLKLLSRLINGVLGITKTAKAEAAKGANAALPAAKSAPALPTASAPAGGAANAAGKDEERPFAMVGKGATPGGMGSAVSAAAMSMVPLLENVDLPPPGSEVDVMVEHLRSLAAKEPERVAEVVKQWVQKHGHTKPQEA